MKLLHVIRAAALTFFINFSSSANAQSIVPATPDLKDKISDAKADEKSPEQSEVDLGKAFMNGFQGAFGGDFEGFLNGKSPVASANSDRKAKHIDVPAAEKILGRDQHQAAGILGQMIDMEAAAAEHGTPHDQAEGLAARAQFASLFGELDKAITLLEEAVTIDPTHATAQYNLACYYARTGRAEQVFAPLAKAIELDKKFKRMAQTDKDLTSVRRDAHFVALTR